MKGIRNLGKRVCFGFREACQGWSLREEGPYFNPNRIRGVLESDFRQSLKLGIGTDVRRRNKRK